MSVDPHQIRVGMEVFGDDGELVGTAAEMSDDTFQLFDLRVRIEEIRGQCTCDHAVGQYFELKGGKLSLPPGQSFCLYALASALPLLPTKQRPLHPSDWMSTDVRVICPDPLCGVVMLIERVGERTLRHGDVSAVPLDRAPDAEASDA